jgi:hypothetical protein
MEEERTIADIADTIADASERYAQKFGREVTLCFVPIGASVEIEGVECVEMQIIQWPHVQIGVK